MSVAEMIDVLHTEWEMGAEQRYEEDLSYVCYLSSSSRNDFVWGGGREGGKRPEPYPDPWVRLWVLKTRRPHPTSAMRPRENRNNPSKVRFRELNHLVMSLSPHTPLPPITRWTSNDILMSFELGDLIIGRESWVKHWIVWSWEGIVEALNPHSLPHTTPQPHTTTLSTSLPKSHPSLSNRFSCRLLV